MIYGSTSKGDAELRLSAEEHKLFKQGIAIKKLTGCAKGMFKITVKMERISEEKEIAMYRCENFYDGRVHMYCGDDYYGRMKCSCGGVMHEDAAPQEDSGAPDKTVKMEHIGDADGC